MNVFKAEEYIKKYTINKPIKFRKNNNLIVKIFRTIIEVCDSVSDINYFGSFTNSYNRKSTLFVSRYFEDCVITDYITKNQHRIHILNYVMNYKYFKSVVLNKEYIVTNLNDSSFTFLNNKAIQTGDITCSNYNTKLINRLSLENKFDVYYDIFERNGIMYIFSIELLEVYYSKMKDTAYIAYANPSKKDEKNYQNIDYLLYIFIKHFKNLFYDLTGFDYLNECEDSVSIHGIYKIKLEPLNTNNKSKIGKILNVNGFLNKINLLDYYHTEIGDITEAKVEFYDIIEKFNNNNRFNYYFFIKSNKADKILSDDEILELFNPTKKQINTIVESDSESDDECIQNESIQTETNKVIEKQLNIIFHISVVNTIHITELLMNLIYNNNKLEGEYNKYKQIYVSKDYDKLYTRSKYFNFKFESKCAYMMEGYIQSAMYHAYLTDNLSEVKSLTYFQNFDL
jgi:hypothetical protein